MAGGGNGRRRVSGDETKNEIGKRERCSRNKWTVKKILAWVWRWNNKKKDQKFGNFNDDLIQVFYGLEN
ncbi:hypothetical protein ACSQ67_021337 [Phaseolus vulgaris]